jgi:hypothetical protein
MEWLFNGTTLLLCLFGLLAIGGLLGARYLASRMRTVEQGHIAVVHWLNRFSRVVESGPYWLRPFEEEITQVYVRQREATASAPKIFTDGGLGVTVDLRYAFRLDPARMTTDELYYSDAERKSQQEMLIREVLLDLVQELAVQPTEGKSGQAPIPAPAAADSTRLDMVAIFSPFAGPKEAVLRSRIRERVSKALLAHGVVVTSETVQIAGLGLPPGLSAAFAAYVEAPFSASARSEFIRRVRAAAPNMSDAGLVQLLNIIQNPSADIQTVFTTGMVNQDMLLEDNGPVVRQRLSGAVPQQPAPPTLTEPPQAAASPPTQPAAPLQPPQPPAPAPAPATDDGADPDYPLTESDNTLLKSTRLEHQGGS